jgi:hypothetical protein
VRNLKAFLFGFLLIPSIAFGLLSEGDKQAVIQQNRLLSNPGFELGKTGWTASGGTFSASTSAKAVGALGGAWDASAASQTLKSTLVAIPDGLKGRNGAASCVFKAATGTATHTITADDGTNNLATPVTIASSTTIFQRTTVNFVFPTSGSIELAITSAANEPNTYIDHCYFDLADGFNLSQVSQAEYVGSITYAAAASCDWRATATTYSDFTTANSGGCGTPTVDGRVSAPATKLPHAVISNYGPGEYYFVATGQFSRSNVDRYTFWRFSDGTNTSQEQSIYASGATFIAGGNIVGRIRNTAGSTTGTIKIQARVDSATGSPLAFIDNVTTPTTIMIYRYPLSTEQAFRPEQMNTVGSVKVSGQSNCLWSTASTSIADYSADSDCSAGYSYTGIASAPSTANTPGGTFTNIPAGKYLAFASGFFMSRSASNASQDCDWELYDGTNRIAHTGATTSAVTGTVMDSDGGGLLGVVTYASNQTSLQLRVRGKSSSASGACRIPNDNSDRSLDIGLVPLDRLMTAPVFVGAVTSPYVGVTTINSFSSKSANYTATTSDETLVFTATSTLSLPAAASVSGKRYYVRTRNQATVVTIDPNSSESVCGQTTIKLDGDDDGIEIQSDGTDWQGLNGTCQRLERAGFSCSGGSCSSAASQSGGWISSISRGSAGRYTVNFVSSLFSSAPTCTSGLVGGASGRAWILINSASTSSVAISSDNSGGSAADIDFNLICSGPR